ncbi:MAG TPA: ABC transporter permease subunit [Candidatus Limnocylindrales bacterium]|nr:ABC transporter permease subunit [Candidatus Limnocylindrales bacterium]
MIAHIANLTVWEWFKLRKRWMLWILLIFALLFAQLAVWGGFFSYRNVQESGGELTVPASLQQQQGRVPRTVRCVDLLSGDPARQPADLDAQVAAGLTAQCRQQSAALPARLGRAYQAFTLPGSIPNALNTVQTLGLILIAILTASAIGIDYGAGTLRSVLTQGTGRWPYLTAKLITLAALAALGLLVSVASVAISSVVAGNIATPPPDSNAAIATWSDAGLAFWKAWVSLLPYIALTAFVTVVARSSAAGMAIGLGYYFAEQLIVALFTNFFSWFQNVADFLLVRNISGFTGGGGGGFPGTALPDSTHAIVVLSIYTAILAGTAYWLYERRDVQGATGGG